MVFNKKDLSKAFSPNKARRFGKKPGPVIKPSTSGSTSSLGENGSQTSVRVIVRIRPENEREMQNNCRTVVKMVDDKMLIFDPKEEENPFFYQGVAQKGRDLLKKQNKELQFVFDRIFDSSASNVDVFEGSTKDLITSLLDGYNCSVFAYGATGAGKTHTMLGSENDPGITYRTVAELFSQIDSQSEHRTFNLGVTYLEVYNENVQDLLEKSGPLALREDGRCGVIVAGLKIISIHNADELLTLLAKGNKNRTQHPTDANSESSRSHAVFQVYVNITNKLDGQVKQVKLSMIDLAGSERASATGCKGARFKEGANINKSLLALGNCINNLADGIKHIPYRDSKLTRLLKDSLGGNCQTVMIANVAPSSFSFEDTYNTLRYANRAKKIKTRVKKNILSCEMHVTGYIKMVEELKKEIAVLKQKLATSENGAIERSACVKNNNTEEENNRMSELSDRLANLYQKKKTLNEKLLSLESTDKILCCRIQYKRAADERLHNLTATVDAITTEEQNASGKSRLNKSLHYFRRQRESLKMQMEATWEELRKVEMDIQKVYVEIKSKGLASKLENESSLRECEVKMSRVQQQFDHAKKISSLQQCEMQSLNTMIKMMSGTLQSYYNTMRGYGTMTEGMKQEFKQLVKMLEGVRNIKWSDREMNEHEEDFYSLTCLSTTQLTDPLRNEMPEFVSVNLLDDEDATQETNGVVPDLAHQEEDAAPTELHNVTITLTEENAKEEGHSEQQNCVDNVISNGIDADSLNHTFSLNEKLKNKRVLIDKNNGGCKTPTKLAKKVSPPTKSALHNKDSVSKENNTVQRSVMSAKSVAILNKLKADKLKFSHLASKEEYTSNGSNGDVDSSLKAIRGKERRGLMTAHPYQKPNGKRFPPAPPSSRVPW